MQALVRADERGFRLMRGAARPAAVVGAVRRFSALGEHGACWLALGAAGAAVDVSRRERWVRGLRAVGVAYLANVGVKWIVRRQRPVIAGLPPLVGTPTQLSFPSSHSAASFAAVAAYRQLLPGVPLVPLAAAMAASRVYLGVHYPSDVLAGAALGAAIGSALR